MLKTSMLVSGIEEEKPTREVLGLWDDSQAMWFPPHGAIDMADDRGEEPLLWKNQKEVVNGSTSVPGPRQRPETPLSEWRRRKEWRERAG